MHVRRWCLISQITTFCATAPFYSRAGLSFDWTSLVAPSVALGTLAVAAVAIHRTSRTAGDRAVVQALLGTIAFSTLALVVSPAQYLALRLGMPLSDPWLAAADAALGVDVGRLANWTQAHPLVNAALSIAYGTFLPQLVGAVLGLSLWLRDPELMWTFLWRVHTCLLVTLLSLALFPAACAFQYLGFESTLPQRRFIAHFEGARSGTIAPLQFTDLEGMISMPSFHVAGALLVTLAFRGTSAFWWLVAVNSLLCAATVMSGAHYLVDVTASVALVGLATAGSTQPRRASLPQVETQPG